MKTRIPRSALEHHIAFVGKTGSGKTGSTKSGVIEPALEAGERVAIIDPTGAWWGLRLDADGKTKGLPIYVFGGDHGDYPLLATQGELMAEAIGTSNTPAILDTTRLRTGERMRFFTDFADAILRVNQGPLRLVIDEAHLFAPQAGTRGAGAMPDMLHAANNLISLGRSRGLRVVLISQRPAKVHKDSLTQVETLVAMRLIAPQDRKAVQEWIADQADVDKGKEIISSLPNLKTGEAWVWSPEAAFLDRVTFPKPKTYDSSKVQGTGNAAKRLSPIDLEKLQAKFAKVKTDAEAKDPKALQKRIAELEGQLRKSKPADGETAPSQTQLAAEYKRGLADGHARGFHRGLLEAAAAYAGFGKQLGLIEAAVARSIAETKGRRAIIDDQIQKSGSPTVKQIAVDTPRRVPAAPVPRPPSPAAGGDGNLTNPQAHLMRALAWWAAMGHPQPTRAQLAAIAGWKVGGSNMRGRLAELSTAGLVHYPSSGTIALTDAGVAAAPAPDTGTTLIDSIKAMLTNPQALLFDALLSTGAAPAAREDVAAAVGWEAGGSNMRGRLAELSSLELVSYPGKGQVALQEWVVAS